MYNTALTINAISVINPIVFAKENDILKYNELAAKLTMLKSVLMQKL